MSMCQPCRERGEKFSGECEVCMQRRLEDALKHRDATIRQMHEDSLQVVRYMRAELAEVTAAHSSLVSEVIGRDRWISRLRADNARLREALQEIVRAGGEELDENWPKLRVRRMQQYAETALSGEVKP